MTDLNLYLRYVFVICISQLPSTAIMAIKPTKRNTLAAIELMTQPRPALIRLMCLIQILYLIRLMCVLIWCTHLHRAPPHLMCSHQLQSRLLLRLFMGWSRRILCTQTYYRSLPWVAHWCDQVQMILMSVLGYGFPAIVWQPGGGLWLISDYPATLYRRSIPSWSTCPSI